MDIRNQKRVIGGRPSRRCGRPFVAAVSIVGLSLVTVPTAMPAYGATGPGVRQPASRHPGARTWYVDCSSRRPGTGTAAEPFNTLQSANQIALGAGDRLLFRRGTACSGMLAPEGGGVPGDPVVIGAYRGRPGSNALPAIHGGGTVVAAVWLADMSYVTIEDLHLTNAGDPSGLHRGLYVTSSRGPVAGVTARDLEVSDVDSNDSFTGGKEGGGIVGQALSGVGRFSGLLIEDNLIHNVSRQGITVYGTTSGSRPPATSPWPEGSTGVVIQGNEVVRVQGDGIVPLGTDGAVVQDNTVVRGNLAGYDWLDPNRDCAAGIWAWDANNTLIQHNEVRDMVFGPSTNPSSLNGCDGEGFDADYNQDGTIIQDNISYHNAGGFVLLCSDQSPHRVVIRYNLSVDDGATFNPAPCALTIDPATNNLAGVQMYDNTIVAPRPRVTVELDESLAAQVAPLFASFVFANNIVDATSSRASEHFFACGNDCTNNLFFGMPVPSTATSSLTTDPRFVAPRSGGTATSMAHGFRLRRRSPAIGAGEVIPPGFPAPATTDYFGTGIADPPTVGFADVGGRPRGGVPSGPRASTTRSVRSARSAPRSTGPARAEPDPGTQVGSAARRRLYRRRAHT